MRRFLALALLAFTAAAQAQSMSDEQVRTLIRTYEQRAWADRRAADHNNQPMKWEDERRLVDESLTGVNLSSLSPSQLWLLADRGLFRG